MNTTHEDRLLTSLEVAELLNLHPDTITSYNAKSQMPPPDKKFGRTPLWHLSTIRKWRKLS